MSDHSESSPGFDDLGLLESLLAEEGVQLAESDATIRAGKRPARIPLSFAQELLWLLDRASPGMIAYKLPTVRRLAGSLDIPALERSLAAIATRHEILRTRFPAVDGEPVQVIDPPTAVKLNVIDLRAHANPQQEAERVVRELAAKPFDLANDHMFHPTLIRLADAENVLLLDTHHIVSDGWSRDVLFRELAECYCAIRAGREPVLPPLAVQYADYALWQRDYLAGERLAGLLDFWRGQLGDANDPLDLPTDRPRTSAPGFAGARCSAFVSPALLAQMKALAREHDATLYMVILAAYMTVLHRYSGSARVLVGSGSAGRTHTETEGLIGYFNNTLVQRGDFAADPAFAALLKQVRDSALGAYDHQEVPLEKLIVELREGQQQLSDTPLFRAVLTMQDALESGLELEGLEVAPFGINFGSTKFDLTLLPSERDGGLNLVLQYRSDLFEPATAERFLGHVQQVLASAIADSSQPVSQLSMLTTAELEQIAGWNASAMDFGEPQRLTATVESHARRAPNTIAVRSGDDVVTYAELDRRANQLAHRLRSMGATPGAAIAIALDRSTGAIVSLLAVLKAGACYVPLAPDAPFARLSQQFDECGAKITITRAEYAMRLPASTTPLCIDTESASLDAGPVDAPGVAASRDDIAYVLFTSGSTGIPKGVAVTHANIANYTSAVSAVLGLDADRPRNFATVSTLAADLGNTAIFPALASGGTLHVLPADVTLDGPRFAADATANPIDVLKITPSHLRALMSAAGSAASALLPREWLVLGGEACPWDLVDEVKRIGSCQVLNHYGPTETTVGASVFPTGGRADAPLAATVPIGRPLANVQLWVLDAAMQQLPVGIPGELFIGGAGVASGYLNRPDLTAERFVTIPGLGRIYRTGDRVRRLPGGAIEFLGRGDGQVKIRGFRVELGEIEQVLDQYPGMDRSVATLFVAGEQTDAEPVLVAYAVVKSSGYAAAHGERPTPERLRAWAAERLPDYMVPHTVVMIDHVPLTPNGKLDLRALPAPTTGSTGGAAAPLATPRSETEVALMAIWTEALKRDSVGIRDNFFELGGHSLIAIRVLGKVSRKFGVRLSLRALFDAPTVEQLAELLDLELKLAALDRLAKGDATGGVG